MTQIPSLPGTRLTAANSPFKTFSNSIYPDTLEGALDWTEWFYTRFPGYRTSIYKLVSYFINGVTVTKKDKSGKADNTADASRVQEFEELLDNTYNMAGDVLQAGIELQVNGNVFVSADPVISRSLVCPTENCGWIMAIKKLKKGTDYEWRGGKFTGTCPACGKHVEYRVRDMPTTGKNGERVRFVYRDPKSMRIEYNRLTGTYRYYFELPNDVRTAILRGDSVYLEDSPMVFLQAAVTGDLIKFPDDKFFSMRTHTLVGQDRALKGWGLPVLLNSFNDYVRLQQLDRFNEAIINECVIPLRILSPDAKNLAAGADPNRMAMPGYMFRDAMLQGIRGLRNNPTQWLISPVPVNYQAVGGDANKLTPVDLIEYETTQALANQGIPQEFKQTTFQVVAPSMGLRMFERQHIQFHKDLNEYTRWKAGVIADVHDYEDMECTLDSTSFIEDDMNKQVLLQLMQAGLISKTFVLKKFGIDFSEDLKQRMSEQQEENDAYTDQQKALEGAEMLGAMMPPQNALGMTQAQMNIQGPQPPGAPMGPAQPGAPMSPLPPAAPSLPYGQGASESASLGQLEAQAQEIAQQLYTVDHATRRRELENLNATNKTLHDRVVGLLKEMKQQVASEAVAQSQRPQG
jgi:hypothetical protein